MPLTNRPIIYFALAASALCALTGCAAADRRPPAVPIEDLPPYTAAEQAVFDDSIAAEVFGLSVDADRADDPYFSKRAERADYISRAKLLTVTSDRLAGEISYHLVLKPVGTPLRGYPSKENIEIKIGRASPSLTLLRSMATEAVGRELLVLLRRYRVDNVRVVHFRGEPGTDETVQAVRQIVAKQEN